MTDDNVSDDFNVWVNDEPRAPNQLGQTGAVLKVGRHVCKTVTLAKYGRPGEEPSKTELRFKTVGRRSDGPGFDFGNPSDKWFCENEEIERLLAFLHADVAHAGRYRVVDTESGFADVMDAIEEGGWLASGIDALTRFLQRVDPDDLGSALAGSPEGLTAAEVAVITQRRGIVSRLQDLIADPSATEADVQRVLGDQWWLFGGRYIGVARRGIFSLDQHDIPLIGADRSLHIVEFKGPAIPTLVHQHRNHWIVGRDVHEAVGQAMNYLRTADEMGAATTTQLRNELGIEIDLRRASALVVIGHPDHVSADATPEQVEQTIRTYNGHLSRVQVVTYATLLDAADRALRFEEEFLTATARS